MYNTLERTNLWIGNCDTKASIIIGTIGVVLSVFLSNKYAAKLTETVSYMMKNISFLNSLYLVGILVSLSFIIWGICSLIGVLISSTKTTSLKEEGLQASSILFFATIAKNQSYMKYRNKVDVITEEELRNDLISQIYLCSKVCDRKFKRYKTGLIVSVTGFGIFLCLFLVGLIIM